MIIYIILISYFFETKPLFLETQYIVKLINPFFWIYSIFTHHFIYFLNCRIRLVVQIPEIDIFVTNRCHFIPYIFLLLCFIFIYLNFLFAYYWIFGLYMCILLLFYMVLLFFFLGYICLFGELIGVYFCSRCRFFLLIPYFRPLFFWC